VVVDTTKSCKPSILCEFPLVRGDCVVIPLVRGDCGGCDWYPSKCRGNWVCWYPSSERL